MRCAGGLRKTADGPQLHLQELGFFLWSPEAETLDFSGAASPRCLPDRAELVLREPNASSGDAENLRASRTGHQSCSHRLQT